MSSWAKYVPVYLAAVALGGAYGAGVFDRFGREPAEAAAAVGERIQFSSCHVGGGYNCVVDGDTIWLGGVKIRVADIDAPETHPPRCALEADLGARATQRLQQLVNEGPFAVQPIGDRDTDQYGRKLRVLVRDGRSLGDILVNERLARTWTVRREPWC